MVSVYLSIILILVIMLTILILKNKLKTGIAVVSALLFALPVLILNIPFALLGILSDRSQELNILLAIGLLLAIVVLVLIIFIKYNISPGTSLLKKGISDRRILRLGEGLRLIGYSIIFGILYYVLISLDLIKYLQLFISSCFGLLSGPIAILFCPFYIFICFMYAVMLLISTIMLTGYIILYLIILITSLNGTIRIIIASRTLKKRKILYPFLMLIPVINIILMLYLYFKVKKELKLEGII